MAAGEAYSLYVEPAAEGANEADGPLSAAGGGTAGHAHLGQDLPDGSQDPAHLAFPQLCSSP
jgi:hypothetical protein